MTKPHPPIFLAGFLFVAVLAVTDPSSGQGQGPDAPKDAPKMRKDDKKEDKKEPVRMEEWEALSPEQKEKLRQALRDVWTDPAVISAREEVKQASDVYQAAIKAAVSRADPSVADIMAKIQRDNSGRVHEHISGRPTMGNAPMGLPPMGMGPKMGFDDQIKPPGFMESLPPEVREKVRKAEDAAMASDVVKSAKAELDSIREEDEALRRKRLEAHRKLRKVTIDEMIRIDPSIADMQKRLSGGDRNNGPYPAPPRREEEMRRDSSEQGKKPGLRPEPGRPEPGPGGKKPE